MTTFQIIVGIMLFAFVTAVLYVWGLRRSMMQQADLNSMLVSKCSNKIMHYLNKNKSVTEKEIADIINGTTVGLFWSKNKLKVNNSKKFSGTIIKFMTENNYIEKAGNIYIIKR